MAGRSGRYAWIGWVVDARTGFGGGVVGSTTACDAMRCVVHALMICMDGQDGRGAGVVG